MLTKHAFDILGMKRVKLSVYDFNAGAIKCYLNAGFKEHNRVERDNGWIAIGMDRIKQF